jgi:endonuclease/exonuclease/phosphatase family metal-dependent hydrolase
MPPFPKPSFAYKYELAMELEALRAHAEMRGVPRRHPGHLLLATWNIANLGVQKRRPDDYRLLAQVCGWFDLVALQEVNDDLKGLYALRDALPDSYRVMFSEASGNQERQAFVYDSDKVRALEKVGRLSIPPSQLKQIKRPATKAPFLGFDRGPYIASFEAGALRLVLVNVHLFFGSEAPKDLERRALETYAVAWWADRRRRSKHAFSRDIVALGDFNLPQTVEDDPIFRALTLAGLLSALITSPRSAARA